MIYINKITGATIDSPCLLSGDDWELISKAADDEEVATVEEMETVEEAEAEAIEAEEIPEEADAEKTKKATPKKRNNKKGE